MWQTAKCDVCSETIFERDILNSQYFISNYAIILMIQNKMMVMIIINDIIDTEDVHINNYDTWLLWRPYV